MRQKRNETVWTTCVCGKKVIVVQRFPQIQAVYAFSLSTLRKSRPLTKVTLRFSGNPPLRSVKSAFLFPGFTMDPMLQVSGFHLNNMRSETHSFCMLEMRRLRIFHVNKLNIPF